VPPVRRRRGVDHMADATMGREGPAPDFATLLQRAEALVPVLRERAPQGEELRQLPDETIADLHRTGLFRILQPKRVGGSELPFRWLLGMWPKRAQDEIWGQSPDNLIGSALIFPRGRATPVDGGYRVTGRWPFSSGVDPSSWNLLGAIAQDEEAGISQPRIFLLPASDYTIIDTWHVIG